MIHPGDISDAERVLVLQCQCCGEPMMLMVKKGEVCPSMVQHRECSGVSPIGHIIVSFSADLDFVGRHTLDELMPGVV